MEITSIKSEVQDEFKPKIETESNVKIEKKNDKHGNWHEIWNTDLYEKC